MTQPAIDREEWAAVRRTANDWEFEDPERPTWAEAQRDQAESDGAA